LERIAQADPDAIVSILPSDHYYSCESAFTAALESAMDIAEQQAESVVLLGAQPTRPEVEYGWIEIGESLRGYSGLFHVEGFQEKPPLDRARALLRSGSLWNTFVMVGRLSAFREMPVAERLDWYFAYNLFRLAGIVQGIKKRVIDGTASHAHAAEMAKRVPMLAGAAWSFAMKSGAGA
jgi:mannose-1-phosphate guanylyltransferase